MAIDTSFTQAANAYKNTANMKGALETPNMPGEKPDPMKPEFSEFLGQSMDKARDAGYLGEGKSAEAIAGTAELHDVVTAVTNAELTLELVVAVRDRVVSAYQDIIKMPV